MTGWPVVILGLASLALGLWAVRQGIKNPLGREFDTTSPLPRDGTPLRDTIIAKNEAWAKERVARGARIARAMYLIPGGILIIVGVLTLAMGVIELLVRAAG